MLCVCMRACATVNSTGRRGPGQADRHSTCPLCVVGRELARKAGKPHCRLDRNAPLACCAGVPTHLARYGADSAEVTCRALSLHAKHGQVQQQAERQARWNGEGVHKNARAARQQPCGKGMVLHVQGCCASGKGIERGEQCQRECQGEQQYRSGSSRTTCACGEHGSPEMQIRRRRHEARSMGVR